MLRTDTVEESTLVLLKKLQQMPLLQQMRLVGGTALALQLGHRYSIDLDLFGLIETRHSELLEAFQNEGLDAHSVHSAANIHVFRINKVKTDIVNYPYEWLQPIVVCDEIKMANLKDIAAMKLEAITNRGTKKDFVDFYFLLQHFSLQEMLEFYKQKYPKGSLFNVVKSLNYFNDAENDPMSKMFIPVDWETVKETINDFIAYSELSIKKTSLEY